MSISDRLSRAWDGLTNKAMPPAASDEGNGQGEVGTSSFDATNLYNAYTLFEVVNRGVNIIADSVAQIPIDITEPYGDYVPRSVSLNTNGQERKIKKNKLNTLLNLAPNPHQARSDFFSQLIVDYLLTGNAFIYWDGAHLYRLSATAMTIHPGNIRPVDKYTYYANNSTVTFQPDEIIHVKENSTGNPLLGYARLASAILTLDVMNKMTTYQTNFFKNSTLLGVAIISKNILSDKIKKRMLDSWTQNYNPTNGARRPIILDGDVELKNLNQQTYKDLEFDAGYSTRESKVLKALGVPPVLLDAGNNANLTPNLKLFYLTTVLPLFNKFISAFEVYFGYDLKPAIAEIPAMLPEARERADSLASLVNAGIITRNEARSELRYKKYAAPEGVDDFADELILPANIAGSAQDKTQGGRPTNAS